MPEARSKGARLRAAGYELIEVAADFDIPSRSIVRAEALINRVETILSDARAVVRGR